MQVEPVTKNMERADINITALNGIPATYIYPFKIVYPATFKQDRFKRQEQS